MSKALSLAHLPAPTGAAQVGFTQSGTGAVARTTQDKLRESVSVLDFGVNTTPGTTDMTAAMNLAVMAGTSKQVAVDLGGQTIAITTVNIPNAKAVTIKNGNVIVTGVGSSGFSRVTTVSPQTSGIYAKYDLIFDNVNFECAVANYSCIYINLAWQDSTAGVVIMPNCSFQLTNGAIGLRTALSYWNNINGRFNMDATSTGWLVDATQVVAGDAHPVCPINSTCNATFFGGIGFNTIYISSSNWNSFEGITFGPGASFYASKFYATKYNKLISQGASYYSAHITLDSGFNTTFTGGYADRNVGDTWPIITVKTTIRTIQNLIFSGGFQVNAQGTTAADLILLTNAGTATSAGITNIVFGDVYFVCGVNNASTPVAGIGFNHPGITNASVTDGCTFQNMYTCIAFYASISRSSITRFTAREITYFATQISVGYSGGYNKFDALYLVITSLDLMVPYYINTVANEPCFNHTLMFPAMMVPPTATLSSINSYFGAGYFTLQVTSTQINSCEVQLVKNIAAPGGGRGGCAGTLVLEATAYSIPW